RLVGMHGAVLRAYGDVIERAGGAETTCPQRRRQAHVEVLASLPPTQVAGPAQQLAGGSATLNRPGPQLLQLGLVRLPCCRIVNARFDLRRFRDYGAGG